MLLTALIGRKTIFQEMSGPEILYLQYEMDVLQTYNSLRGRRSCLGFPLRTPVQAALGDVDDCQYPNEAA